MTNVNEGAANPAQKTVLLGVTGCIAAYKSCEIVRGLQKAGVRVKVVMTEHATEFVGPTTFRALTHETVAVGLFDDPSDPIHHVSLAQEADVFLIAPCTANVIAKIANGIADDLLTTTALATTAPLVIAPAMNVNMYENGATRYNIGKLHIRGARFTQWGEVEVQIRDGQVQLPAGFSLIWVKHRHGRHQATPQIALLEGWGELRGAIATSYSHDSHNLVVLGRDAEDMALAANQLIASGGGMALAQQGEILAHVAMPIAGMLSDLPAAELARQFRELRDLSSQVADWEPPYRVFKAIEGTCLACNAGPHLTDLGLTDGGSRQIVDPLIACRETPAPTPHNNNPQGA